MRDVRDARRGAAVHGADGGERGAAASDRGSAARHHRAAGTPPGVARALERALAKTPADRHPTAAAFAEALAPPTREAMSAPAGATAPMPGLGRVLALYLSASGAVLALVFGAMLALGLPDWFFPGAVLLLLLGLPIMIATGLVQAGHAPARQLLAPVRRWLTWRRAVMGGVLAF